MVSDLKEYNQTTFIYFAYRNPYTKYVEHLSYLLFLNHGIRCYY